MIVLFDDNETLFRGLGLGVLKDAKICYVSEELNDAFELQMVYPITGQNYEKLRLNRILFTKTTPYSAPQPFRIYKISKPINGMVTVDAFHISYDMNGIPVNPVNGKTLKDTLDKIQNGSLVEHHFHLYTDKNDTKSFKTSNVYNMRALLFGSSDSVLEKYEGELSFDNFNVYLLQKRGTNRGAQVRYAKNLKDITHEISYDRLYNGVYPYVHQETTTQATSTTTDGFTQVYIVGSKPYQDGWLSYSQNGEPYHPVDESPVQVATEGNFYQKVYTWNTTTQRYSERIYNEMVTLIDQVGNLLGSSDTPSWIYIDWSKLPTIVCKANADGYFKAASESEWTYHKKGEIIFENSIKDAATNLMIYYSEVVPTTTTSETEETTEVTHVELDDKIIWLDTDAAKEMKFNRVLSLNLSNEFQETPTKEQLEAKAKEYIEKNKIGQYKYSTSVTFVDLSSTTEGVQYTNLERIELGDTVKVIYEALGVDVDLRVIRTQYNALLDRYEKIELGEEPEKISGETVQNGDNVSSLTNDVGYADITTVNKLIAKTVTADYIKALNAQFSKAQIEELTTARIKVSGLIEATQFELDTLVAKLLTADNAVIKETLEAGTIKVKGDISIVSGEILIEDSGKTKVFKVDRNGNVTANSVKITGGELNINDTFTVSTDGILSAQGAQISGNVEITSGSIELGSKFKVTEDGTVYASGATISGEISADTGSIAGFVIDKDNVHGQYLRDANSKIFISPEYKNLTIDSVTNKKWTLIAGLSSSGSGAETTYSAKFKVATDGTVYATEAVITGKITSNDVTITGGSLNIGNNKFIVTNEGAVTATDITITGGSLNINSKFSVNNTGELFAQGAQIQNGNISIIEGSISLGTIIGSFALSSLDNLSPQYYIWQTDNVIQQIYGDAESECTNVDLNKTNLTNRPIPQDWGNIRAGTSVPTFQVPFWDSGDPSVDPPDDYDTYWYVGTEFFGGIEYDLWIKIEGPIGYQGWNTSDKVFVLCTKAVTQVGHHVFEVDNDGNVYANSLTITGGHLHIQGSSADTEIKADGKLIAVEADILGKITATSGYIGTADRGFTITENSIYNGFDDITSESLSGGIYIGTDGIRLGQNIGRTVTFWSSSTTIYKSSSTQLSIVDSNYPNDNYEGGVFTMQYWSRTYKRIVKFTPVKSDYTTLYEAKTIEVELPKESSQGSRRTVQFNLTQSQYFLVTYDSDSSDTNTAILNIKLAILPEGFVVDKLGNLITRDVKIIGGELNIHSSDGTKVFSVSNEGVLYANSGTIGGFTIEDNKFSSTDIEISQNKLQYGDFEVDKYGSLILGQADSSYTNRISMNATYVGISMEGSGRAGIQVYRYDKLEWAASDMGVYIVAHDGTTANWPFSNTSYYSGIHMYRYKPDYRWSMQYGNQYTWEEGLTLFTTNYANNSAGAKSNWATLHIGYYKKEAATTQVEYGFPNDIWSYGGFFREGAKGWPIPSVIRSGQSGGTINRGYRILIKEIASLSNDGWSYVSYSGALDGVYAVSVSLGGPNNNTGLGGAVFPDGIFYYVDTTNERVYVANDNGRTAEHVTIIVIGYVDHDNQNS